MPARGAFPAPGRAAANRARRIGGGAQDRQGPAPAPRLPRTLAGPQARLRRRNTTAPPIIPAKP